MCCTREKTPRHWAQKQGGCTSRVVSTLLFPFIEARFFQHRIGVSCIPSTKRRKQNWCIQARLEKGGNVFLQGNGYVSERWLDVGRFQCIEFTLHHLDLAVENSSSRPSDTATSRLCSQGPTFLLHGPVIFFEVLRTEFCLFRRLSVEGFSTCLACCLSCMVPCLLPCLRGTGHQSDAGISLGLLFQKRIKLFFVELVGFRSIFSLLHQRRRSLGTSEPSGFIERVVQSSPSRQKTFGVGSGRRQNSFFVSGKSAPFIRAPRQLPLSHSRFYVWCSDAVPKVLASRRR